MKARPGPGQLRNCSGWFFAETRQRLKQRLQGVRVWPPASDGTATNLGSAGGAHRSLRPVKFETGGEHEIAWHLVGDSFGLRGKAANPLQIVGANEQVIWSNCFMVDAKRTRFRKRDQSINLAFTYTAIETGDRCPNDGGVAGGQLG